MALTELGGSTIAGFPPGSWAWEGNLKAESGLDPGVIEKLDSGLDWTVDWTMVYGLCSIFALQLSMESLAN